MARSIAASDGLERDESSQIGTGDPDNSQLAHHGGSQPSQRQQVVPSEFDKSKFLQKLAYYDAVALDFRQIDAKLQNMMSFMSEFVQSFQTNVSTDQLQ